MTEDTPADGNKRYTIIVNGTKEVWTDHRISYQQVVQLAFPGSPSDELYTVSYASAHGRDGMLAPGQDAEVTDGIDVQCRQDQSLLIPVSSVSSTRAFRIEVREQHVLLHDVPYVTANRTTARGTLACTYIENAGSVLPPDNHQVWWTGGNFRALQTAVRSHR